MPVGDAQARRGQAFLELLWAGQVMEYGEIERTASQYAQECAKEEDTEE